MRWLLELLSICNYIDPLIETGKDINHAITGKHGTFEISVDKGNLGKAKKILGKRIISTTSVAFDNEESFTVECYGGEDGYGSVRDAMKELQNKGVYCWVFPPWA